MIRNVVIHVSNEQPLLADLYDVPSSGDVGLVCTNMRMMDGKRPIFVDHTDSTFFFPYLHVRFIEIPVGEMQRHLAQGGSEPGATAAAPGATAPETRSDATQERLPAVVPEASEPDGEDRLALETDEELDIDEDFLQRVRDI